MTEKSHTLSKFLFVLGWTGLVALGTIDAESGSVKAGVAELVRTQLLATVLSAASLLPVDATATGTGYPHR